MTGGRGLDERVAAGAREAVAAHGWQGATLEQIARAAGLSRMTLHRHGYGREEVFALLAETYERDFRAALTAASAHPGTGAERLASVLAAVCEVTERHLGFLGGLDDATDTRLFHDTERGTGSRHGYVDPVEAVVRDGVEDGTLVADDAAEVATLLVNAVDRTYRHLRAAHGWPAERARSAVLELVLGGVRRRAGRVRR
jgi:AcrR family transcriptional regulator